MKGKLIGVTFAIAAAIGIVALSVRHSTTASHVVAAAPDVKQQLGSPIGILLVIAVGAFLYFLPAIVASRRNHHQQTAICVLNVLLGWTLLGWVAALVWACTATPARQAAKRTAAA